MTDKPLLQVNINQELVKAILEEQIQKALKDIDIPGTINQLLREKSFALDRAVSQDDVRVDAIQVIINPYRDYQQGRKGHLPYLKLIGEKLGIPVEESDSISQSYFNYYVNTMFPSRIKRKELSTKVGAIGKYFPVLGNSGLSCLMFLSEALPVGSYGPLWEMVDQGMTSVTKAKPDKGELFLAKKIVLYKEKQND